MNTDILQPTCRAVTSRLHALPNAQMYFGFQSTDASSLRYDILIGFIVGEVCNTHMVGAKIHINVQPDHMCLFFPWPEFSQTSHLKNASLFG
jgi:hypothetical protein